MSDNQARVDAIVRTTKAARRGELPSPQQCLELAQRGLAAPSTFSDRDIETVCKVVILQLAPDAA